MRVLVISATSAIMASATSAIMASASCGVLNNSISVPIIALKDYDSQLLFIREDLPKPPKTVGRLLRGVPCAYYKHDYG